MLLFDFDGVLFVGDLPVLAHARHCAELLPGPAATALIDGVRFFLEGRSTGASWTDLSSASDGHAAVELLATAAGLPGPAVAAARRRARSDLAASAFALDPPDGLAALLTELAPRVSAVVVTGAGADEVTAVLAAGGLAGSFRQVLTDVGPADWPATIGRQLQSIGAAGSPRRLMAVGARWAPELAAVSALGGATALVDRFARAAGSPDLRASTVSALLPGIRAWALDGADRVGRAS